MYTQYGWVCVLPVLVGLWNLISSSNTKLIIAYKRQSCKSQIVKKCLKSCITAQSSWVLLYPQILCKFCHTKHCHNPIPTYAYQRRRGTALLEIYLERQSWVCSVNNFIFLASTFEQSSLSDFSPTLCGQETHATIIEGSLEGANGTEIPLGCGFEPHSLGWHLSLSLSALLDCGVAGDSAAIWANHNARISCHDQNRAEIFWTYSKVTWPSRIKISRDFCPDENGMFYYFHNSILADYKC